MKWIRDQLLEARCKQFGWDYEIVPGYALADVDMKVSEQQQSRVGRVLSNDTAFSYAMLMEGTNATFKMPALNIIKNLPVVFLSGLHRGAAMEIVGIKNFDTYVFHLTKPLDLDLFPRLANVWESARPITTDERLANIAYMIEHHRMLMKEAAEKFGVPYNLVNAYMRQNENMQKAALLGVNTSGIPRAIFTKVSPLRDNDTVYAATLSLIGKNKLVGAEAEQFIGQVRKGSNEGSMLAVVSKWDATLNKHKTRKKAAIKTPVRTLVTKLMSRMRLCLEANPTITQLQLQPDDLSDFFNDWSVINNTMAKIVAAGKNGKLGSQNGKR